MKSEENPNLQEFEPKELSPEAQEVISVSKELWNYIDQLKQQNLVEGDIIRSITFKFKGGKKGVKYDFREVTGKDTNYVEMNLEPFPSGSFASNGSIDLLKDKDDIYAARYTKSSASGSSSEGISVRYDEYGLVATKETPYSNMRDYRIKENGVSDINPEVLLKKLRDLVGNAESVSVEREIKIENNYQIL